MVGKPYWIIYLFVKCDKERLLDVTLADGAAGRMSDLLFVKARMKVFRLQE